MISPGRGLIAVAVLLAFVAVSPLTLPVQLSYVQSDSMEPSIQTYDGYVLTPAFGVESGDVITFRTQERTTPFTHRVVEVTEDGYVTKGDNNRVTDQESGYGYVQEDEVIGEAFAVGGSVVTIPKLGRAHDLLKDNGWLALGVVGALLLSELVGSGKSEGRSSRGVTRVGGIVAPLILVGALFVIATVVVSADVHTVNYVATDHNTESQKLLTVGEPATRAVLLRGSTPWFMHRIPSAHGMQIANASFNETSVALSVNVPPPDTTGVHAKEVRIHEYPATLPKSVLRTLHEASPLAAVFASVGVLFSAVYAAARLILDWKKPVRYVSRNISDKERL